MEYDERPEPKAAPTKASAKAPTPKLVANNPRAMAKRASVGPGAPLPHAAVIQQAFGRHDISRICTYEDAVAAAELGARAFTFGHVVVFGASPDLFTAAHEAAHVVQQRAGRRPGGELDAPGDALEHHADAVAAAVVAGRSAEALLDRMPGSATGGRAVQRKAIGQPLTATQYVEGSSRSVQLSSMEHVVADHLDTLGVFRKGPFPAVLGETTLGEELRQQFLRELRLAHHLQTFRLSLTGGAPQRAWQVVGAEKLAALVAPESLTAIVDRSRPLEHLVDDDGQITGTSDRGSPNPAYVSLVGLEIANALARRYRESLSRIFPRFGRKFLDAAARRSPDRPRDPIPRVPPEAIVASHPLDLYVIDSLCQIQQHVEPDAIARYVAPAATHQADQVRAVKLQVAPLGPGGGLAFHWVRAPEDATVEEVAHALFGKSEEAYRLIAMRPFWGFRARDVLAMLPERQFELRAALVARSRLAPDLAFQLAPQVPGLGLIEPPEIDPVAEILGGNSERVALERAKLHHDEPSKQPTEAISKLGGNLRNLAAVERLVAMFHRPTLGIDAAIERTRQRKEQLAATCVADPDASYALATQQATVLSRIANAMTTATQHYLAEEVSVRPVALEPTVEVVDGLVVALDALELPEIAAPRVLASERLVAELPIRILEAKAHEAARASQQALDGGGDAGLGGQTELVRAKAEHQLLELAQQRLEVDPAERGRALAPLAT